MIIQGDVEEFLAMPWKADCIIMDPPDNLGLPYDGYLDSRFDYYSWLKRIILGAMDHAPIVWVSYYHIHDFKIKGMVADLVSSPFVERGWEARTFVWTFTFGQNRESDCGSGYRPILRLNRVGVVWDTESIKVPSWRSEHGDPRAKPGGRVPLDVWDFPRVVGNSAERRSWHPTQHPEALYIRMMKMSGAVRQSPQCWRIVDLFGGTGTALRAATALRVKNPQLETWVVERSAEYCKRMAADSKIKVTEIGQFLPPSG